MPNLQIVLTEDDIDALARIAQAEAVSIATHIENTPGPWEDDAATSAYGSVVGSILNRVASDSWYGGSVEEVINFRTWSAGSSTWIYQYTPLASATGNTWEGLPPADPEVTAAVVNYINYLINGGPSIIGSATHYINPTVNGTGFGWSTWGQGMTPKYIIGENPFDENGNPRVGDNLATHVFGNGDVGIRPKLFDLTYNSNTGTVDTIQNNSVTGSSNDFLDILGTYFSRAETERPDPLVLDLNGNGQIDLNMAATVYFDTNSDGFAEAVNWVAATDGLLARDVNGNGNIDNNNELFGNAQEDGFSVLSFYDVNTDLQINASDAIWSSLVVWRDSNQDGYSQSSELLTLASLGITSINLGSVVTNTTNPSITHDAAVTTTAGSMLISNVLFDADFANTRYVGDYTLNIETLFLPTLRGHGTLADLHIAASMDNSLDSNGDSLKDKLLEFSSYSIQDLATLVLDKAAFKDKIENILYHWAGISIVPIQVAHASDARPMLFLEKYLGQKFVGDWFEISSLGGYQGQLLNEAMVKLIQKTSADILAQTAARELFDQSVYSLQQDGVVVGQFTLSESKLTELSTYAAGLADTSARSVFWKGIATILFNASYGFQDTNGLNGIGLTAGDITLLNTAIHNSDASLYWDSSYQDPLNGVFSIEHALNAISGIDYSGTGGADTYAGTGLDDILRGLDGDDTLSGGDGNDYILGQAGADIIHGDDGDDYIRGDVEYAVNFVDTIYGGNGNDRIEGEGGSDTLFGGDGDDTIWGDSSSFDTVGDDIIDGGLGFDVLLGGNGNDTLIDGYGTTGQNLMDGGAGYNIFRVVGASEVWIDGGAGQLELMAPFQSENDLHFQRINNFLYITSAINGQGLNIYLSDHFATPRVNKIVFSSGYEYDLTQPIIGLQAQGTEGNDNIQTASNLGGQLNTYSDTIHGLGGNDTIDGYYGDDFLYGDDGNDTLIGSFGNDQLFGGNGNDVLDSGHGNDFLDGGAGNDLYIGGYSGANRYIVSDGNDTLRELATNRLGTLVFQTGVVLNDLSFSGNINGDLIITHPAGSFKVEKHFLGYGVLNLEFSNGSIVPVSSIQSQLTRYGTALADTIQDIEYWGNKNDIIYAGAGNDVINAGDGNDIVYGEDGDDEINGFTGNNSLYGGNGNDRIYAAGGGTNILDGGLGDDLLRGADNNSFYTGLGKDILEAGVGTQTIYLPTGITLSSLTMYRSAGSLYGGDKGLILEIDQDNQVLLTNHFSNTATDKYSLVYFSDGSSIDIRTINFDVYGTSGNDVLNNQSIGVVPSIKLYGYGGSDTLYGTSGADILDGGDGNDNLWGGAGNDLYIFSAGTDTIFEDSGTDVITFSSTYSLDNLVFKKNGYNGEIWASDGNKVIIFNQFYSTGVPVIEQFNIGGQNISFSNVSYTIEGSGYINGTIYNDILTGSSGSDDISGYAGNDTYIYSGGLDYISENGGIDKIVFGAGVDAYNLNFSNSGVNSTRIILNSGINEINVLSQRRSDGDGNIDTLVFHNGLELTFSNHLQWIRGTTGADTITGDVSGAYADTVLAGSGNDQVNTGGLNDQVDAGAGDDLIAGGTGNDYLFGNSGNDTYIYNIGDGQDVIHDISGTMDSIIFGNGITLQDIIISNINQNDVRISFSGNALDHITLKQQQNLASGAQIEKLVFSNGDQLYLVNVAPTAKDDAFETANDVQLSGNVILDNGNGVDADPNGDTISVVPGTINTAHGVVVLQSNGGFTYTALNNYVGNDSFDYTVLDPSGLSDTGTVLINVRSGNVAPVAQDDNFTFEYAVNGTGNVLLNNGNGPDTDINGNTLTVIETNIVTTQGRSVTMSSNGDFIYAFAPGYVGIDNFTYTVSDGLGGTDTAAVTISITPPVGSIVGTSNADTLNGTSAANTIFGLDGSDILTGLGANDFLYGNSGDDSINGGSGADTMAGGVGDDIYVVDNTGDLVVENANEGSDLVQSSVSYTLGSDVENLTLMGTSSLTGTGNDLSNTITGNSGSNTINGGLGIDTMIGGLGNDTYFVDDAGDVVIENNNEGTDTIQSSVTYTASPNVERLTLTGAASINAIGNGLNNTLTGNSGNNTLNGLEGADTMSGGTGDDVYIVDNIGDVVTESAGAGNDSVQSSVTYVLRSNLESLTLTGVEAINGTGNTSNNTIIGNVANNILDGGAGIDVLVGGLGDDVYIVNSSSDVVTESVDEGNDSVESSATYILSSNIENLTLAGSSSINGTGNDLDNIIIGNIGNNILNGGLGIDTMFGGLGNDTYIVDEAADIVIENDASGTDTIQSYVSYTASSYVERLTLLGLASINATGNMLNNILTGNSGNNILNGGEGADTMIGGLGDDFYIVDNTGDIVTEGGNAGNDSVESYVSFSLSSNVENLTLVGPSATNGTGNSLSNTLIGNSLNNLLDGGAGVDVLIGGVGDDIYVVNTASDVTIENADEGSDTVQSSASYVLSSNVESLTLTGTSSLTGTGNSLDNYLTGNIGNNVLNGGLGSDTLRGGSGNDRLYGEDGADILYGEAGLDNLWGGTGADIFVMEAGSAFANIDVINDFSITQGDKIELSGLLQGYDPLTQTIADFVQITTSGANSILSVDADGGANNFLQIATLNNVTGITDEQALVNSGNLIIT